MGFNVLPLPHKPSTLERWDRAPTCTSSLTVPLAAQQARNMELQNLLGERDSQLAKLGTHEPASSSRQRGGRPNASKGHSNDPDAEARSSVKQEAEMLAMHIHQQVRGRQHHVCSPCAQQCWQGGLLWGPAKGLAHAPEV